MACRAALGYAARAVRGALVDPETRFKPMIRSTVLPIVGIVLSIAAAMACSLLLQKHMTGTSGESWFESVCQTDSEEGGANCAKVLASPYSYIPPRFPDKLEKRTYYPAAFVGLIYYTSIAVWLIGVGLPSPQRRRLHLFPLLFVAAGLAGSAYFTYIMFSRLEEWCPWCLLTHGLNLLIGICLVLMLPKRATEPACPSGEEPSSSEAPDSSAAAERDALRPAHPSGRLVLITVLAIAFIVYAQRANVGLKNWKQIAESRQGTLSQCKAAVARLQADTKKLVTNWQLAEVQDIPIRQDNPARTHAKPGEATWTVVVFSDFQCPHCGKVAKFLEEQVQPMFAGRLKIVFKHYPLNKDCNGNVQHAIHKHACTTAAMAEAARQIGGNEAFWEAHDFLFGNRELIKKAGLSTETIAIELGFDPPLFTQKMRATPAAKRIWDDVNVASTLKITATPSIFVEGKKVDSLAILDAAFWDAMATRFWREAKQPRPPRTKTKPTEAARNGAGKAAPHGHAAPEHATEGNRDQPAGP